MRRIWMKFVFWLASREQIEAIVLERHYITIRTELGLMLFDLDLRYLQLLCEVHGGGVSMGPGTEAYLVLEKRGE